MKPSVCWCISTNKSYFTLSIYSYTVQSRIFRRKELMRLNNILYMATFKYRRNSMSITLSFSSDFSFPHNFISISIIIIIITYTSISHILLLCYFTKVPLPNWLILAVFRWFFSFSFINTSIVAPSHGQHRSIKIVSGVIWFPVGHISLEKKKKKTGLWR